MTPDLRPLAARIRELTAAGTSWGIRAAEVARLLGTDEMEMIRRVYTASLEPRSVLDVGLATETFGPENGPELVTLAEILGAPDAEGVLTRTGIHLPHVLRVELVRALLEHCAGRIGRHVLDGPKLSAMLKALGTVESAERTYLAQLPSLEVLAREAAAIFCRDQVFDIPELALATASRVLEMFLRRKVVTGEQIYGGLRRRIREHAAMEGYHAARERRARPEPGPADTAADALSAARRCMELDNRRLTPDVLKTQYRKLMKRWHPDVNPQGLERAQAINAAYAELTAALTG